MTEFHITFGVMNTEGLIILYGDYFLLPVDFS